MRAAVRFAPWTDEETRQIAGIPHLAGLAWVIGVDHPLIRATVEQSLVAAVAAICAGATDPILLARVETDATIRPDLAAKVAIHCPTLATAVLLATVAEDPWAAAQVIAAHPTLATAVLLATVAEDPWAAAQVIAAHPTLAIPEFLNAVCYKRAARHAVVDACGPLPRLWQRLTDEQQEDILRRYRCTPAERAWIAALATRTPPAWTAADDQMAARFPWRDALRTAILGVTGARE